MIVFLPARARGPRRRKGLRLWHRFPSRPRLLLILSRQELSPEEAEAVSWEQLIAKIKASAKSGQFYSSDKACSTTVHFWCVQVVGALKGAQAKQVEGSAAQPNLSTMARLFPEFLLRAIDALSVGDGTGTTLA